MARFRVLFTGVKVDDTDDADISGGVIVDAVGIYTNADWVTFHSSPDNYLHNVVAAFPTNRVISIRIDES